MKNYILNPKLAADLFDGEYIIANLDTGLYYSVQGLGVSILSMLPFSDITTITRALEEKLLIKGEQFTFFLNELISEEIVLEIEGDDVQSNWAENIPEEYVPAKLNRYADMKDLLLLDPIHDVNDEGWAAKEETK